MFSNTIAAIATPLADGAISIIRVSGDQAIPLVDSLFSKDLLQADSHTIHYGYIQEEGKKIDEVLVSVFRAPKTFTREDTVEINAHGGQFVTRQILTLLLAHGARLARPGEFSQRAFLNGRIDLSQAEAVNDMITASNAPAAALALDGIQGSVKKLLEPLINDILEIIAQIEVNIDYPEYDDVQQLEADVLLPLCNAWLEKLDAILARARTGQLIKKGLDTVIVGKPNVGKSSLLNALLEEEKAIVTDIPGTTRDLVEGSIHIGDVQLNLIDTAGIRQSADVVEQIGIEKSRQKMEQADLILLVLDASRELEEEDKALLEAVEGKNVLILSNKTDLQDNIYPGSIPICAAKTELDGLFTALRKMYKDQIVTASPVLSNERQIGLLLQARKSMINAKQAMELETQPDLIEIDIQDAYTHLKEILGEVHRDDLLDTLFSRFCLGK